MTKQELVTIEKGFWFEGAEYYQKHISEQATFVFPGMRLGKDDGVNAADNAPRWDKLEITDEKLVEISDEVSILMYHATGIREGEEPYNGNITSVYRIENEEPKMIFHQHTPDSK